MPGSFRLEVSVISIDRNRLPPQYSREDIRRKHRLLLYTRSPNQVLTTLKRRHERLPQKNLIKADDGGRHPDAKPPAKEARLRPDESAARV
jgi:hypothetical protein